jgi:hypothetical protein
VLYNALILHLSLSPASVFSYNEEAMWLCHIPTLPSAFPQSFPHSSVLSLCPQLSIGQQTIYITVDAVNLILSKLVDWIKIKSHYMNSHVTWNTCNIMFQHPVALVFNYMHIRLPSQVQHQRTATEH